MLGEPTERVHSDVFDGLFTEQSAHLPSSSHMITCNMMTNTNAIDDISAAHALLLLRKV